MRVPARIAVLGALFVMIGFAGWRITHLMWADAALKEGDATAALALLPADPDALLKRAESQLAKKQLEAAAGTARKLLTASPIDGRAYRVLAQVADVRGQKESARKLFAIAARRAPRDLAAHAWLAQDALERGVPDEALIQIDHVLTLSPSAGGTVFPVLVKLSADPAFADALADVLRRPPSWRAGMLNALQRMPAEDREAADQVLSALQRKGGFDATETQAWIQSLLKQGRWGEAYARWASPIAASRKLLPLLYNGDFAGEPEGDGFDWLMPAKPGVILEFEPGSGDGRVLHARFLGRRMVGAFLEHRLLLPPGNYELHVRQRAEALRSDHGVGWTLACEGSGAAQAYSETLDGSRGWRLVSVPFIVPANDCVGQWLRMGNAGPSRAGQLVSGEFWLEQATIERVAVNPPERG